MKKLILASAIMAITAATANAATIYEGNGLKYEIKGDWQIQLRQDAGEDENPDVEFDDLEIKNSITYDLQNGLIAFGQLDFGFKDEAEDKREGSKLEEAYVGLAYEQVAVSIGKRDLASDEFGVEAAYENTLSEDGFDRQGTDGDDVIRVDATLGMVNLIASVELDAEGESSENGEAFDIFAATEFSGLELAAAYQTRKENTDADSVDTWGVSAAYDAGVVKVGADYTDVEDTEEQYNLVAIVPVAKTTKVAVGAVNVEPEQGDDVTEWYANVTYTFPAQKNVSAFAEIADTDEDNVDAGFLTGLRVKF
ncbi:porin [Oceanospirillum sediminis]|uniref:Porin n=1 Tax=Oceanospirillum sediminis TaxID=2760088 RepID=A0A839ITW1_9GAMM|nr:porin [Oceanospirillum sediminis]MBB1488388.1 porin [Oceanospirillum sediminis]